MLKRLNMMDLRCAPGEMLERIRWNREEFALMKQGKLAAFVISRDTRDALFKVLPLKVPCDFCCVEVTRTGRAEHENNCPALVIHRLFEVEPVAAPSGETRE